MNARCQICVAKLKYRKALKEYNELRWACKHEDIQPTDAQIYEKLKTDMWACCGAECTICGEDMGWFCPKSPTHKCEYEKDEHGRYSEYCMYCDMPSERK